MYSATDLGQRIAAFHDRAVGSPHHRYLSWEHCYRFFQTRTQDALLKDKDGAALQLGFYLASWGMYRGSSFLLQRSYTVHTAVVETLVSPEFSELWNREIGADPPNEVVIDQMYRLFKGVKEAYLPHRASDILATKVILGTIGCLPAVDRF